MKKVLVATVLVAFLCVVGQGGGTRLNTCDSCGDEASAIGESVYQDCLSNQGPDGTLVRCQTKRDRAVLNYIIDNCLFRCGVLQMRDLLKKRFPEIARGIR